MQTIFTPNRPLHQKSCASARIGVQTSKCSAGNQPTIDGTKYDVVDNAFVTTNTINNSRSLLTGLDTCERIACVPGGFVIMKPGYFVGSENERRSLFPFRKRSLPFLTVDAAIGNQAFSHDKCNMFPGLSYNKANNTFLNSLRRKDVEAKVEFTLEMMESARVTSY